MNKKIVCSLLVAGTLISIAIMQTNTIENVNLNDTLQIETLKAGELTNLLIEGKDNYEIF